MTSIDFSPSALGRFKGFKAITTFIAAVNEHLVGTYGMEYRPAYIKFAKFCMADGVPANEAASILKIHNTTNVADETFTLREAYLLGVLHAFIAISNRKV